MDLDKNYMVLPPFLYWRETFAKTRAQIEQTHQCSFLDYMHSEVPFKVSTFMTHPMKLADFEALNVCAAKMERERYSLLHFPRPCVWPWRLYWSHGDWSSTVEEELQGRLAEA